MSAGPLSVWDGRPVAELAARWSVPVVEAWATLGSTNERAAELIDRMAGAPAAGGPEALPAAVVVADEQTRGRGRRGKPWCSAAGRGLWISLALPGHRGDAGVLPLLVGLAAAEALEAVAPPLRVGLKWPNDLLLEGGKVGGVLCAARRGGVVAGVGINLRAPEGGFPPELRGIACAVEDAVGAAPERSELAGALVERVRATLRDAPRRLGAQHVRALAARDALAGRAVETEQAGTGVAAGVASDGALRLTRPDGSEARVVAGSVRLR